MTESQLMVASIWPVLTIAAWWLVFGGTHIGLAAAPVKARLVRRLGATGFTTLFYAVASVSFTLLVHNLAVHRFDGPPGLALGAAPAVRWVMMACIVVGVVLLWAALASYPRSPMALFNQTIREPRGLERITRHPFFAGVALLALMHMLLAARLVETVFFAGLALFSVVGAWHQDRKLLAERGAAYGDYLAATSAVPFAAIIAGRQRLVWAELPYGALATGVLVAGALRWVHDAIFAHGGLWVILVVVGGAAVAGLRARRRARRMGARNITVQPSSGLAT